MSRVVGQRERVEEEREPDEPSQAQPQEKPWLLLASPNFLIGHHLTRSARGRDRFDALGRHSDLGSSAASSGWGRGMTSARISLPPSRSTVCLPTAIAVWTAATSPRTTIVTYAAPIFSLPTRV